MPDPAARLAAARSALDAALAGLVPTPEPIRRAIEDLVAAKVQAMAEESARELEDRTRDHNRPIGV